MENSNNLRIYFDISELSRPEIYIICDWLNKFVGPYCSSWDWEFTDTGNYFVFDDKISPDIISFFKLKFNLKQ